MRWKEGYINLLRLRVYVLCKDGLSSSTDENGNSNFRGIKLKKMRSSNKTKRMMDDENNKVTRCLGRSFSFVVRVVSWMGSSILRLYKLNGTKLK